MATRIETREETKAATVCALCGFLCTRQPVTRGFDGIESAFCCAGCANVYAILLESGAIAGGQDLRETELFKRSLALGLISTGSSLSGDAQQRIPEDAETQEALFQVSGMWCSSCAWLIEHALAKERGVLSAEVFFASDLLRVKYSPRFVPPHRIVKRVGSLGYRAAEYTGESQSADDEKRDLLLRLGVAGFLWLNIMTLSVVLYVGYFEQIAQNVRRSLPFVLMALATPVIFYSAQPILRLAWTGGRNRAVRMETLLSIGILAAYCYSVVQTIRGESHVYFDTASAIVTLVLTGKLVERSAKEKTSQAITRLYRMLPKKARVLAGGRERFVSIDALGAGEIFAVKAGERIPADGVVVEGESHADESLLTGESKPVSKTPGSRVAAGSINLDGVIHARATRVGGDSTLSQIIGHVERALSSRSKLEQTVDRVSRAFVPGVVVLALLTFASWWLIGHSRFDTALMRAITVLVIACPCALGLATPLALTAAVGAASRRGMLVSDSRVLETIRTLDVVILDKTGTVTEGDFSLREFEVFFGRASAAAEGEASLRGSQPFDDEVETVFRRECLPLVASLEQYSEHPLGRALVKRAAEERVALSEAREVEVHKGVGLTGLVENNRVFAGNRSMVERAGAIVLAGDLDRARRWEEQGLTVVYFGWNGALRGLLAFGDRIKPEAGAVIRSLQARGLKVVLLSGDARATTERVAALVGANECVSESLPQEKTETVRGFQQRGLAVAMIGDGVNDAPALAQADLGIALQSGADVAMKASALVLMDRSLSKVLEAFDLAKRTGSIVRQNLFWAFVYNGLGISLAVAGILNPILAAAAMLLSSLSVIGNSLRLRAER